MQRYNYPHEMFSIVPLQIGRLQTVCQFPVMAGDSIGITVSAVDRLSPLARSSLIDPEVLNAIFFVPARHYYDNWKDFVREGVDENQTLKSVNTGGAGSTLPVGYLGCGFPTNTVIPLESVAPYNQVWNRNFRVPSDNSTAQGFGLRADDSFAYTGESGQEYNDAKNFGLRCAYPKTIYNTGLISGTDDDDKNVPIVGGRLDVTSLAQIEARYGTEQLRSWFAASADSRYKDIIQAVWKTGKGINVDADQRPTMLALDSNFLTSSDINATGSNIGQYQGKGITKGSIGIPPKFFPEHGMIIVVKLIRYPLITYDEGAYLMRKANPSYKERACDPRILSAEPPQSMKDIHDQIFNASFPDRGESVPYGNWYRGMPSAYVHDIYEDRFGFPFLKDTDLNTSYKNLHYVQPRLYDRVFQTQPLSHAQSAAKVVFDVKRMCPSVTDSIFAGAS